MEEEPQEHIEILPYARGSLPRTHEREDACVLRGYHGFDMLGDKYSRAMGATFMDADGSEKPFIMGCYGIGVSRAMAAAVEQRNDEHGIIWPAAIAPAHVAVIPLSPKPDEVTAAAEELAGALADAGLEVVIDDRDERAGVKFNDNDLLGWPVQVVVGKRGLKEGVVEVKERACRRPPGPASRSGRCR